MRIKVEGDNDCARSLRMMLRQAGFAVVEFLPSEVVALMPQGGFVISVETGADRSEIYCDSVDSPLEAAILRHVAQLSKLPVMLDRPGGKVHSDREMRFVVPASPEQESSVEIGVLRGLLEITKPVSPVPVVKPQPWYKRRFWRQQ